MTSVNKDAEEFFTPFEVTLLLSSSAAEAEAICHVRPSPSGG